MKKLVILSMAFAFALTATLSMPGISEAIKKDCFALIKNEWKECGKKKLGLVLVFQNVCVETMELNVCFETADGKSDCQRIIDIPKDGAVEVKSCDNTGKYTISACENPKDCK